MLLTLILVSAYFLGSIPVGFLVAKSKGIDIRKVGSGNIGATNVHRALGRWAGLAVFLADVAKGFIPALTARIVFDDSSLAFAAGMSAVVGHCLSPFLGFKGGKGIATGLGVLFGTSPVVAACAFGLFFLFMLITRYVSLSSIIAAIAVTPFGIVLGDPPLLLGAYVFLAVFIVWRHRANIGRLRSGTEPKFSLNKEEAACVVEAPVADEPKHRDASLIIFAVLTLAAQFASSNCPIG